MATKKHVWNYENVGGSTRVKITTGADIVHLGELDPKKWTVLSCPSTGLEIDEKSLQYVDTDADGRIRVNDIVATAQWITAAIKNADLLIKGADSIDIEQSHHNAQQHADHVCCDIDIDETDDDVALFEGMLQIFKNTSHEMFLSFANT